MLDRKFDLDPDKGKLSWAWLGLYLTSKLRGPYTDECSLHAVQVYFAVRTPVRTLPSWTLKHKQTYLWRVKNWFQTGEVDGFPQSLRSLETPALQAMMSMTKFVCLFVFQLGIPHAQVLMISYEDQMTSILFPSYPGRCLATLYEQGNSLSRHFFPYVQQFRG